MRLQEDGYRVSAPTVYDVAERAQVSIATVSRVYRNPDTVRAQTRERVLAVARELGYVPSGNARGLASRTTGVLGLCFPDYADPEVDNPEAGSDDAADDPEHMLYADEITRGMERAARRHGYALLIAASLAGGPESLVAKVAGRVDGFAVLARTVATEDLEIISRRLPIVMIAGPREIDHLDHLQVANDDGEYALTRHLIADHGLTRLAFIGGGDDSPDATRPLPRVPAARSATPACRCPPSPATRGNFTQADGAGRHGAAARRGRRAAAGAGVRERPDGGRRAADAWSGAASAYRRTWRWSASTASRSAGSCGRASPRSASPCAASARPRWTCWSSGWASRTASHAR